MKTQIDYFSGDCQKYWWCHGGKLETENCSKGLDFKGQPSFSSTFFLK